jgi:methylglyoxal synthase
MKQEIKTKNITIAIVVDDDKKHKLIEWSYFNRELLRPHTIIANDEIALILHGTLNAPVQSLPHRNYGGYRELATMLEGGRIDLLICIGTLATSNGFQVCVGDLVAIASANNIMVASNEATADVILRSMTQPESPTADTREHDEPAYGNRRKAYK